MCFFDKGYSLYLNYCSFTFLFSKSKTPTSCSEDSPQLKTKLQYGQTLTSRLLPVLKSNITKGLLKTFLHFGQLISIWFCSTALASCLTRCAGLTGTEGFCSTATPPRLILMKRQTSKTKYKPLKQIGIPRKT